MKVYEKIKAYMIVNNIDHAVVSNSTGISQNQLAALLDGKETLYARDLKAICLALNISPEAFIDYQGGQSDD